MNKTLIGAVLAATFLASPAMAIVCEKGEGKEIEYGFGKTSDEKPTLDPFYLTVRLERCIAGPSTFKLQGMPGVFSELRLLREAIEALQKLATAGLKVEELAPALTFMSAKLKEPAYRVEVTESKKK